MSLELPGRPAARVDIAYDRRGVLLIRGDITPVLVQALRDAIAYHDDGKCGDAGHLFMVEQYERAIDDLEPPPALTAAPQPPDPG